MNFEAKLTITAEQFYQQLLTSILYDIRMGTGNELMESMLYQGYSYEKTLHTKMGSKRFVQVTIEAIEKEKLLSLTFLSSMGQTNICYELESRDDGTYALYRESYVGGSYLKNLNQKLMMILFSFQSRKKFNHMVERIEQYVFSIQN